ncbi:glycerate kinase [Nakamurella endophytica]|uniref:Glycerate kinase n=1 Tax=Nakamurella endophytica TaxID=1748367 RepID=A0A917SKU3_9ACTN|nr:glycerate kinase [Nakamurella endophytica]
MRVVVAPDKFRGTATAGEICAAVAEVVLARGGTVRSVPQSDGGEGMLDVFGGADRTTDVTGPLGVPVTAAWRLDPGGRAVVETSAACGLALAGGAAGNRPEQATTRGVGELLAAALRAGATRILVGLGGSATTDGGAGAVAALEEQGMAGALAAAEVLVCCDVDTRFTDAARVFGPQKGADPEAVRRLTERLRAQRQRYLARYGLDPQLVRGSGAAGGLGGGLAVLGARLVPGHDLLAVESGLDAALDEGPDLVVTGEGRLDATSLAGKVVGGVARRAAARGIEVVAVVGAAARGVRPPGVTVLSLTERVGRERALSDATGSVRTVLGEWLDARAG